jgi:putative Holliday junction resolvase
VSEDADTIVVGYPRNQSGEPTAQTAYVEEFAKQLHDMAPHLVFQDESLTSVLAEQRLRAQGKPYTKGDIDAQAAAIILQDYLERL